VHFFHQQIFSGMPRQSASLFHPFLSPLLVARAADWRRVSVPNFLKRLEKFI